MCTLTVTPLRGGRLVAMNRDESKSRPPCSGIRNIHAHDVQALYPEDGASHGTWLSTNDSGFILALTNYYPGGKILEGRITRGVIAKDLALAKDAASIRQKLEELRYENFGPFRLIIIPPKAPIQVVSWDKVATREELHPEEFFFLTSAAFVDETVAEQRRTDWQRLIPVLQSSTDERRLEIIRSYHLHHDPQHPRESVCMERPEAKTFSYTEISSTPSIVELRHSDQPLELALRSERIAPALDQSLHALRRKH